jgi:hypothetical protein
MAVAYVAENGGACDVEHNTVVNAVNRSITCGAGHAPAPDSTNFTMIGNVMAGGHTDVQTSGACPNPVVTYNLALGQNLSGTGNINANPVFLTSPSSGYYHYQLASSSPGYHAASDGKSMGIAP